MIGETYCTHLVAISNHFFRNEKGRTGNRPALWLLLEIPWLWIEERWQSASTTPSANRQRRRADKRATTLRRWCDHRTASRRRRAAVTQPCGIEEGREARRRRHVYHNPVLGCRAVAESRTKARALCGQSVGSD